MSSAASTAWRCTVCGYVHQGPQPPDACPVCGAAAADFEAYAESLPAPVAVRSGPWQCRNCRYLQDGPEPPDVCPICGAANDFFDPVPMPASAAAGSGGPLRLVVVGAGIAGVSAAESARKASPESSITLVSSEKALPYYRLNLTRYLAGEIRQDALPIHPASWYAENRVDLLSGAVVETLAVAEKAVRLKDGRSLPYDRLILAMGSHPFVPPLPGADLPGVKTLRTAEDADEILGASGGGAACVCIGGGILGLEIAGALARRGGNVTLLEGHDWPMPRQLDRTGGQRLGRALASMGINLRTNARTREIVGATRVTGVVLQSGETVPAQLVAIATGIRPDTHLARKAGLAVSQGIVVDGRLRTSNPDIFAAGDVAEHNGVVYGTWGPSQYQGAIAGLNAVGVESLFGGLPRANTLKVLGLDLFSIGQFEPPDGSYLVVGEETETAYRRFVFHDGRLAGAILMGDARAGAAVKKAVEAGTDFSGFLAGAPSVEDLLRRLA